MEIKVLNLENKQKTLSLTGEKKETHLDKVKRINENEKILKEQMKKEKDQEQIREIRQNKHLT